MSSRIDQQVWQWPRQGPTALQIQDWVWENIPSSKDIHLDDIMSYNDILDYVKKENNNEDGEYWRFKKILSHSLISGKKEKDDKIDIQMIWKTGATSTECFEAKIYQLILLSMQKRIIY